MHFQGTTPFRVTHTKTAQSGKDDFTRRLEQQSTENRAEASTGMAWSNLAEHEPRPPVKNHTSSKLRILPSSRIYGIYMGCQRLPLFFTLPDQTLSQRCMVQHPFPDTFPSPAVELVWDYMPGQDRRTHPISKDKSAIRMVSVQGTQ